MNWIEEFTADCSARGLTKHTIETYRSNIKAFLLAFDEPLNVNLEDLIDFLGELRARDLDGSTLKGYFAAISSFYDFLVFDGDIDYNPVPAFRKRYLRLKNQQNGENTRQLISVERMSELINLAAGDILAKNMMLFLAKTGLRRGEFIGMDIWDLDLENMEFRVGPFSKRSNRLGFIDYETAASLKEYLDWREPLALEDALWINEAGYRVSKNCVYYTIVGYASELGIHNPYGPLNKKFSTHNFRHWYTTWLRKNGMPKELRKVLRGDHIIDAEEIYDHIDNEELRRSYLKCIPYLNVGPGRPGTLEEWIK